MISRVKKTTVKGSYPRCGGIAHVMLNKKEMTVHLTDIKSIGKQRKHLHEHQVPNSDSDFAWITSTIHMHGGLIMSGFESSLPPCKHNQSGSGSESPINGASYRLHASPITHTCHIELHTLPYTHTVDFRCV